MDSALFLVIAILVGVLLCAAGYWLSYVIELWVLGFFVENPLKRYLMVGLFTLVSSITTQPLLLLIGLPVLGVMAWRDPDLNLR